MNTISATVSAEWDRSIVPTLTDYIRIPCQSPDFDPDWATNGLLEEAMDVLVAWAKAQHLQGAVFELHRDEGMTPFLVIRVAAFDGAAPVAHDASTPTVLMYGHMDKQPPLHGAWADGLGPYDPVMRGARLYGRGGADDGYAMCASVLSLVALQKAGLAHARTSIVIEASEESAESHLEHYIRKLLPVFGPVSLVVCLDSAALTWDRLWITTSLRGVTALNVTAETLREGMHSGIGGGAVPDTFRVQRLLLDRLEDAATGEVRIPEAHCEVPAATLAQMQALNEIDRAEFLSQFPLVHESSIEGGDNVGISLRTWWKPSLTVIGASGLPSLQDAGNIIRQQTTLAISMRTPPLARSAAVGPAVKEALTRDPPCAARVTVDIVDECDGWAAPQLSDWLEASLTRACQDSFGKGFASCGIGGSIPFIGMLGELFPSAQFVVSGVLGPTSNAHGPNEFLDVDFAKKVNTCIARVLADHQSAAARGSDPATAVR